MTAHNEGIKIGTVWVIEGDDHEVEVVEAETEQQALDYAQGGFTERYGRYDPDLLSVAGNFIGDIDDIESLRFVPTPGAEDERRAYRALENW